MSKKKKDISEAVTLESMDENIVVADTEAEGEPSVSEEKEEKKVNTEEFLKAIDERLAASL